MAAAHGDLRGVVGQVELPAAGGDGVAALYEEAVAEVNGDINGRGGGDDGAGGAVEVGEGDAVATVDDVEEAAAAALGAVNGEDDGEVGGELDEAGGVALGEGDVGDAVAGRAAGVGGEAQGARISS